MANYIRTRNKICENKKKIKQEDIKSAVKTKKNISVRSISF